MLSLPQHWQGDESDTGSVDQTPAPGRWIWRVKMRWPVCSCYRIFASVLSPALQGSSLCAWLSAWSSRFTLIGWPQSSPRNRQNGFWCLEHEPWPILVQLTDVNLACDGIWLLKFLILSAVFEINLGALDMTIGKQALGVTDITPRHNTVGNDQMKSRFHC